MTDLIDIFITGCYVITITLCILLTVFRKWKNVWLLSVFSFFATIVVVDLILTAIGYDPYSIQSHKIYDPDLGARNTPNYHSQIDFTASVNGDLLSIYWIDPDRLPQLPENESHSFDYRIDQNGFRNPPDAPTKDISLLAIGDSFTIASTLPFEKTWAKLVTDKLGIKSFYEASVNQIGPENYLRILRSFAPRLRKNAIVLIGFFEGNDLHNLYLEVPPRKKKNLALLLRFAAADAISSVLVNESSKTLTNTP